MKTRRNRNAQRAQQAQVAPTSMPSIEEIAQANLQLQMQLQAMSEEKIYWANQCMQLRAQLQQFTQSAGPNGG